MYMKKKLQKDTKQNRHERYYFGVDLDTDIDIVRRDIKKDYKAYEDKYGFLPNFNFDAVVKAAAESEEDYAEVMQTMQKQLLAYLSMKKVKEDEVFAILQTFMAIWNYYPSKKTGKSPIESMRQEVANDSKKRGKYEKMADADTDDMLKGMMERGFESMHLIEDIYKREFTLLLGEIGGIKKDVQNIFDILSDPKQNPNNALMYVYKVAGGGGESRAKKRTKYNLDEIQDIVRVLSGLEWYVVSEPAPGQYTTRLFQEMLMQNVEQHKKKGKIPPPELLIVETLSHYQYIVLAHIAIADLMQRLPKSKQSMELHQVAHHMLTWLAVIDMRLCLRYKNPEECAAIIYQTALYISNTIEPEFVLECSQKDFEKAFKKEFKGIGSVNVREAMVLQLSQTLMCNCADPVMMMANITDIPEDIRKRISRFAPCVEWGDDNQKLHMPFN